MLDDGKVRRILIKDVLYAPMLTGSLLSVKKLTDKGKTVEFTANRCYIRDSEKLLAIGRLEDHLYKLTCKLKPFICGIGVQGIEIRMLYDALVKKVLLQAFALMNAM